MKYIKHGLTGFVVLLLTGCLNSALNTGTNMQDAQKAVAEGRINETYGGLTGLDYAVTRPYNTKIITYLLENGADISTRECRHSSLVHAIEYEFTLNQYQSHLKLLDNIELLLKYGTNCKDYALLKTMLYADGDGTNKYLPLAKMLLAYGADPTKKQTIGWLENVTANTYMQKQVQREKQSNNNHELWGKLLAIGMGAAIADSSSLDSVTKAEFLTSYSTDVLNNDGSMSNTEQWKNKTIQQNEQRNLVSQNNYNQKLEEVRERKMRVVAQREEIKQKETYICYRSEWPNHSLPYLILVARVAFDHCLFSHHAKSVECKPNSSELDIYRDSSFTYPCDNIHGFDSINKVYQNIIDEHKRTAGKNNYYGNEKLIRLNR